MIRIAYCQSNRLLILLERAEAEIRFSMANGMLKMKMEIYCHGSRIMPKNFQHLGPIYFSLLTTFKEKKGRQEEKKQLRSRKE